MIPTALRRRLNVQSLGGLARNLGFGAFSRITALGSQFVVVILLGKFLDKAVFGDFMIVFALTRVLSLGIGTGFATLLVYHISRKASAEREASLHRSVIALVLLLAGLLSFCMWYFAGPIATLFSKPTLVPWLESMAPFLLFSCLLTVSVGALEGRGQITKSITALELVPNLVRLALLPALVPFGLPIAGVAGLMTVSVAIPWLVVATMVLREPGAGFAPLTRWDVGYSTKLVFHSFAAMQMQGIDMLVVGWLFTSDVAADYAIASRVAALIPFFQQIIVKSFMAKAGRAIHDNDGAALQGEYDRIRVTATMLVTLTGVGAMLAYPILAYFVENFRNSMAMLAVLAAGSIYRSYFPGSDALIRVAGHASYSLTIMLISVAFLVLLPLAVSPWIGAYSVAFSMLLSGVILNPVMARFIQKHIHVRTLNSAFILPMILSLSGSAIAFFGAQSLPVWIAGCVLIAASLLPLVRKLKK